MRKDTLSAQCDQSPETKQEQGPLALSFEIFTPGRQKSPCQGHQPENRDSQVTSKVPAPATKEAARQGPDLHSVQTGPESGMNTLDRHS